LASGDTYDLAYLVKMLGDDQQIEAVRERLR
jgi:hypothetical protein